MQPVESAALDAVYKRHKKAAVIGAGALHTETKVEWTTTDVAEAIEKAKSENASVNEEEVLLLREQDAQDVSRIFLVVS